MKILIRQCLAATSLMTMLSTFSASAAAAQEALPMEEFNRYEVRVGGAFLAFEEDSDVFVGGQLVPGGKGRVDDLGAAVIEFGYYIRPDISIALQAGIPPEAQLNGGGTLSQFGELGSVTFGPAVLSARKHILNDTGITPYFGAGLVYAHVFDTSDAALKNIDVDNSFGVAVSAGADFPIAGNFGGFVDIKKIILNTSATFNAPAGPGGALVPGRADLTLDPTVVTVGASYRF